VLATLGFVTIGLFLLLTFTKRVSVLIALVLIPLVTALIGGFGDNLGEMVLKGLIRVAPTAIMIAFAVLYFSLMIDAGLFDPLIRGILRVAKRDPLRIAVGTAVLTLLVALDGDGASTFLITISAMLPVYRRLGMSQLVLAGIVCLGAGVMNMVPWGGPTARAMAALDLDSSDVFTPVLPAMGVGIAWVLFAAYMIGRRERRRLGELPPASPAGDETEGATDDGSGEVRTEAGARTSTDVRVETRTVPAPPLTRAGRALMVFNLVLTLALLVALVLEVMPLPVLFVVGFVVALLVNRPGWDSQQDLLERHGRSVVLVTTMIFAAGVFTGILTETKMITEMASSLVSVIPSGLGGFLPAIVALTGMPLSLVFTPDAYYFGVLPVLAETAVGVGGDPAEIARAAILGQMTTGFPLSPLTAATFILVGMAGVQLGQHQRFIFGWAFGTTVVMTITALLTGAI
jgi:citrate-Mg2+:H+ or citrate-Ca2+:H+ symporter, CitMHS family